MITIINKYTGEEICKYSSALVSESTNDSFIAPVKASGVFRGRWTLLLITSLYLAMVKAVTQPHNACSKPNSLLRNV